MINFALLAMRPVTRKVVFWYQREASPCCGYNLRPIVK